MRITTENQIELLVTYYRGFAVTKFACVSIGYACDEDTGEDLHQDIVTNILFRARRIKDLEAGKELPLTLSARYSFKEIREAIDSHLYEMRHPCPF